MRLFLLAGFFITNLAFANDQLLYDLAQRRQLLDDMASLADKLAALKDHAPALAALIKDLENAEMLEAILQGVGRQSSLHTLQGRAEALEHLITISRSLEALMEIKPGVLELLTRLEGAASLEGLLQGVLSTDPVPGRGALKLLFARPETANYPAEVALQFDHTRRIHTLGIGQSISVAGRLYTLKEVEVAQQNPLMLRVHLDAGGETRLLSF